MEAISSWTLALLRLLGALHWSWTWTPMRAQYSLAQSYLNAAQRPLWILEDELMKRLRVDNRLADYGTTTRATTLRRQQRQNRVLQPAPIRIMVRPNIEDPVAPPSVTSLVQRRLQLPSHYVQQRRQMLQNRQQRQYRRLPQSLPIFDSAPGDNTLSVRSYPVFVYNGSKGELLVNTMLSAQRYPMQEPVPGQVLYPPSTPMFRPKPIVERFRLPGRKELHNLTLIPFYAHEAITAPPATTTPTTTTDSFTDCVTVPLTLTTPMPTPYETQLPRSKRKRNPKKTKQYNAFRSPQEVVQWQPLLRSSQPHSAPDNHRNYLISTTESSPMVQEELKHIEQLETDFEESNQVLSLSQQQHQPFDEIPNGSNTNLQIIYMDESVESPSDTLDSTPVAPLAPPAVPNPLQRHSSRYSLKREYFAFPVYTLGKLLQVPTNQPINRVPDLEPNCSENCSDHVANTWFIMNSRYKRPHHNASNKDQQMYFTSKYVQGSSSV